MVIRSDKSSQPPDQTQLPEGTPYTVGPVLSQSGNPPDRKENLKKDDRNERNRTSIDRVSGTNCLRAKKESDAPFLRGLSEAQRRNCRGRISITTHRRLHRILGSCHHLPITRRELRLLADRDPRGTPTKNGIFLSLSLLLVHEDAVGCKECPEHFRERWTPSFQPTIANTPWYTWTMWSFCPSH